MAPFEPMLSVPGWAEVPDRLWNKLRQEQGALDWHGSSQWHAMRNRYCVQCDLPKDLNNPQGTFLSEPADYR